jgi:ligand-binding SRPBCC domain-containing protein
LRVAIDLRWLPNRDVKAGPSHIEPGFATQVAGCAVGPITRTPRRGPIFRRQKPKVERRRIDRLGCGVPKFELRTPIDAPPLRVFDLARSIDLHTASMATHRETAVGGVTTGLIGLGESVTWRARHFFVTFLATSRITAFDPPRHFRDEMVSGPFARFAHDHHFEPSDHGTLMRDIFDYESPLGILGALADALILRRHMVRLLQERNEVVKRVAESTEWRRFLSGQGLRAPAIASSRRSSPG